MRGSAHCRSRCETKPGTEDEVERPVAHDLIGDVDLPATRVICLWRHRTPQATQARTSRPSRSPTADVRRPGRDCPFGRKGASRCVLAGRVAGTTSDRPLTRSAHTCSCRRRCRTGKQGLVRGLLRIVPSASAVPALDAESSKLPICREKVETVASTGAKTSPKTVLQSRLRHPSQRCCERPAYAVGCERDLRAERSLHRGVSLGAVKAVSCVRLLRSHPARKRA